MTKKRKAMICFLLLLLAIWLTLKFHKNDPKQAQKSQLRSILSNSDHAKRPNSPFETAKMASPSPRSLMNSPLYPSAYSLVPLRENRPPTEPDLDIDVDRSTEITFDATVSKMILVYFLIFLFILLILFYPAQAKTAAKVDHLAKSLNEVLPVSLSATPQPITSPSPLPNTSSPNVGASPMKAGAIQPGAPFTDLNPPTNFHPTVLDAVIIDENLAVRTEWLLSGKNHGKFVMAFQTVDEFLKGSSQVSVETDLFIDLKFIQNTKIEAYTKKIYDLGYQRIFLTTSSPPLKASPSWVSMIVSKSPPWGKKSKN